MVSGVGSPGAAVNLARSGLPLFNADGSLANWPRSASAAASWTCTERHNQSFFGTLEHRFDNIDPVVVLAVLASE